MPSKYKLVHSQFYIENSDVPINKLNIVDSDVIHEFENDLLRDAYGVFVEELNDDTIFDEEYFKSLHRRTFESLYDWAGEYRAFNMAKGESRFCQGAYVDGQSKVIFEALKNDKLLWSNNSNEEFSKRLAYHKCELIALHPFPELNGRITRMFFDMIAYSLGYEFLDYSKTTPEQYIGASIECVQFAECGSMEKIIYDGLRP